MISELPIRRRVRLPDYDYSAPGEHFVTVCCHNRKLCFDFKPAKEMIEKWWFELANKFSSIELDEFVVMPDHFHGILIIKPDIGVFFGAGSSRTAPTTDDEDRRGRSRTTRSPIKRKTLGCLIGAFKTVSTKRINETRGTPCAITF
jgi:hypothetical protein